MTRQLVEETRHFTAAYSEVHLACGHVLLLQHGDHPNVWLDKVDAKAAIHPDGSPGVSILCPQCLAGGVPK